MFQVKVIKNFNILIHLILGKYDRIGFQPNKRNSPRHYGSSRVELHSVGLRGLVYPVLFCI